MVGGEDDDRVLSQTAGLERRHEAGDLVVDVGDRRDIGVARVADVALRHLEALPVAGVEEAPRMRILLRVGNDLAGHGDVGVVVEVPVMPAHRVGVVGMREAHGKAERPPVAPPGEVVEPLGGEMGGLIIEFELVGDLRHPRLGDGGEVVVRPVDPLIRPGPVRCPAEIGRAKVGRQPLLETVQLVGADEMHLAGKRRAVAQPAQMVGEGRDRGTELGRVVVALRAARQLAGHERGARRRARGGVCRRRRRRRHP